MPEKVPRIALNLPRSLSSTRLGRGAATIVSFTPKLGRFSADVACLVDLQPSIDIKLFTVLGERLGIRRDESTSPVIRWLNKALESHHQALAYNAVGQCFRPAL